MFEEEVGGRDRLGEGWEGVHTPHFFLVTMYIK